MGELGGKVALITGGARGLGASIAEVMHREDATVVIADVLVDEGTALADELGDRAGFVEHDVTDEESWTRAVRETIDRYDRLDVVVNNAGVISFGPLSTMRLDEYRRIMDVNATGVFLGTRDALGPMTQAGSGVVVNISSVDGFSAMPATSHYAASKHAVLGLTRAAALEVAALGVRVVAVCPGIMLTPMAEEGLAGDLGDVDVSALVAGVPMKRFADPVEVAELASFLASDRARFCTGCAYVVDGGLTAGLPVPG